LLKVESYAVVHVLEEWIFEVTKKVVLVIGPPASAATVRATITATVGYQEPMRNPLRMASLAVQRSK
jgi:hypothetical protein